MTPFPPAQFPMSIIPFPMGSYMMFVMTPKHDCFRDVIGPWVIHACHFCCTVYSLQAPVVLAVAKGSCIRYCFKYKSSSSWPTKQFTLPITMHAYQPSLLPLPRVAWRFYPLKLWSPKPFGCSRHTYLKGWHLAEKQHKYLVCIRFKIPPLLLSITPPSMPSPIPPDTASYYSLPLGAPSWGVLALVSSISYSTVYAYHIDINMMSIYRLVGCFAWGQFGAPIARRVYIAKLTRMKKYSWILSRLGSTQLFKISLFQPKVKNGL